MKKPVKPTMWHFSIVNLLLHQPPSLLGVPDTRFVNAIQNARNKEL